MAEFQMVNKMESVVKLAIDDVLNKHPDLCRCSRCRMDMTALSLNNLPPRYVVTEFGDVLTQYDLESCQWKTDVMIAVVHALDIVKQKPRHK